MQDNKFPLLLSKIVNRDDLTDTEMESLMQDLTEGRLNDAQIAAFLAAMRMKGETVEEITASAIVLGRKAKSIDIDGFDCFDTCGTGGDGANTFNVSTATAFILAAAGVKVAKHGNRSVSSRCGSADVIEKLGISADIPPECARQCILNTNLGFMFAPIFHGALKNAAFARKSIGIRTIFNILGPMLNPAGAKLRLLGVYNQSLTTPVAMVLKNLGVKRAMVVHGMDGLDEITITTKTYATELKDDQTIIEYTIDPKEYGISYADKDSITGGDPDENADIITRLFSGERGPKRDMLLLNAAAALYVAGKALSIIDGLGKASKLIDDGSVKGRLEEYRKFVKECVGSA
jgi:anthranilate phosphoribosyltransferase